ncbi:MAG: cyclic nucleotide-binding domain-containing protein [Anaerolineae bacterium]|nr:cyclic nucleotide-binding domain-containing protein [Anaerolineae bacterium]
MSIDIQDLVRLPFTEGCNSDYLALLAKNANKVDFASGSYLLREGDPADQFYIILQGRIALGTFISGRGFTTIQTIGDREIVGWSWLIPPHQWRFSALVILPTQVVQFDGQKLREACEADPSFGYFMFQKIAQVLGQRLEETRNRLEI